MNSNTTCPVCHKVIETQRVFSENNQVYLKKDTDGSFIKDKRNNEWFPINFQWIPIVELNNNFNHQSNKSSK